MSQEVSSTQSTYEDSRRGVQLSNTKDSLFKLIRVDLGQGSCGCVFSAIILWLRGRRNVQANRIALSLSQSR